MNFHIMDGEYLKATYSKNWTIGDSGGFFGEAIAGNGSDKIGTKMLGIDFPSNPKFAAKMDETKGEIKTSFYLLNNNNNNLIKNFKFLNAIYAGAQWLHLPGNFIRCPNVYHVQCPGRFQIYWAALDITVTFAGKLRKNVSVSKELQKYTRSVDEDMLWPDAWKVDAVIRDLTPNNFNLYAEYYLNGVKANELASLEYQIGVKDIMQDIRKFANDRIKKIKGYKDGGSVDSALNESYDFKTPDK